MSYLATEIERRLKTAMMGRFSAASLLAQRYRLTVLIHWAIVAAGRKQYGFNPEHQKWVALRIRSKMPERAGIDDLERAWLVDYAFTWLEPADLAIAQGLAAVASAVDMAEAKRMRHEAFEAAYRVPEFGVADADNPFIRHRWGLAEASYAKNKLALTIERRDTSKPRPARLAEALNARYSHREGSYILSPSVARRWVKLLAEGWDGGFNNELEAPRKVSP